MAANADNYPADTKLKAATIVPPVTTAVTNTVLSASLDTAAPVKIVLLTLNLKLPMFLWWNSLLTCFSKTKPKDAPIVPQVTAALTNTFPSVSLDTAANTCESIPTVVKEIVLVEKHKLDSTNSESVPMQTMWQQSEISSCVKSHWMEKHGDLNFSNAHELGHIPI